MVAAGSQPFIIPVTEDRTMNVSMFRLALASVIALVGACASSAMAQQPQSNDHTAALLVKKMDCPAESMPAINELSKVPGVRKVVADYATQTLTITPKANAFPSPLALWEAAERVRIEPIKLITPHGTYDAKPRRQ
jgi:periplasmic mercuric ion binding protein